MFKEKIKNCHGLSRKNCFENTNMFKFDPYMILFYLNVLDQIFLHLELVNANKVYSVYTTHQMCKL